LMATTMLSPATSHGSLITYFVALVVRAMLAICQTVHTHACHGMHAHHR
jgi:hypothetical protein